VEATVRRAGLDDAPAIARVHVRSWQGAYRLVFGAALDDLVPEAREPRWREWLSRGGPPCVFVAERAGEIVGFVSVGASLDPFPDPETGELYALYVLPAAEGTGVGRLLMERGLLALAELGCGSATLWVLEDNPRARRFYERGGWTPDGSVRTGEHLGVQTQELRLRHPLS
jgi:GNAT superfamily N-acetyltransferase